MANKGGRPTKFKKRFCKVAKDFLAKGYSTRILAGHLKVNESTIYEWIRNFPEFSMSIDEGRALGEKYYVDLCIKMAKGSKGNFNACAFLMKNIYRYSDSPEGTSETKPINITFSIKEKNEIEDA